MATTSAGSGSEQSVTFTAVDNAGNVATHICTYGYSAAYGVTPLYDQTKAYKLGSTIPIKLEITGASDAVVVRATGLTQVDGNGSALPEDSGNANPDHGFRNAGRQRYIYNLSTKGLSAGIWRLTFTVDGVASDAYAVSFIVR